MKSPIAKAAAALRTQAEHLEKLEAVEKKVLALLKTNGFTDLDYFVEVLHTEGASTSKKKAGRKPSAKAKGKAAVRKTDIKRPRVTAAKVAKMKALDKKGMSQNKIAKIIGTSVPTVGRYAKKGFKFEE